MTIRRILLVERNDAEAKRLQVALRTPDQTCCHVHTLPAAMDVLASSTVDAVLLDSTLPNLCKETLRQLRNRAHDAALLLLGARRDEWEGVADEVGIDAWGRKSLADQGHLQETILTAIDRRQDKSRLDDLASCLTVVREVGKAVIQGSSTHELTEMVCQSLVASRRYVCAWIALVDEDGNITDYTLGGHVTTDESTMVTRIAGCPAVQRLRTGVRRGNFTFARELSCQCDSCFHTDLHPGSKAIISPMFRGQRLMGIMAALVPRSPNRLDDEGMILGELADGIALALETIELHHEQRRSLEALRESERRYAMIADAVPRGFVHILDRNWRFLFARGEEIGRLGLSSEELVGRTLDEFGGGERIERLKEQLLTVFGGESISYEREYNSEHYLVNVLPLEYSGEDVQTVLVLGVNVSTIKKAEEDRASLERQLRQAEKMEAIGQLAGGIAHDFNNQLSVISGLASLLEVQLDDPVLRRYASGIVRSSQRSADLTGRLLSFSRKRNPQLVPVNVHDLVKETVFLIKRSLSRCIKVTTFLDASQVMTHGDPSLLQNAILNICINGQDAMPDGGEICLKSTTREIAEPTTLRDCVLEAGTYFVLEVRDTGVGMSEAIQERVFESFFTTKPVGKGTGMGLAAVHRTVKDHGGGIELESVCGQGTTFRIYLPVAGNADQVGEKAAEIVQGRGYVMVVDDEELCRIMLRDALRLLGYDVVAFADGIAAGIHFQAHHGDIDLVILDMEMPEISGIDTIKLLRKSDPHARILVASGFGTRRDVEILLQDTPYAFLQKPFQISKLSQAVAQLVTSD